MFEIYNYKEEKITPLKKKLTASSFFFFKHFWWKPSLSFRLEVDKLQA